MAHCVITVFRTGIPVVGLDSSVGIVTGYGLHGPGIEFGVI